MLFTIWTSVVKTNLDSNYGHMPAILITKVNQSAEWKGQTMVNVDKDAGL
jgi:hypothetical protein